MSASYVRNKVRPIQSVEVAYKLAALKPTQGSGTSAHKIHTLPS